MTEENLEVSIAYPALLGVSCDGEDLTDEEGECYAYFEGDFLVRDEDTQETRFGYVINHVVANEGWVALGIDHPLTSLTFCPEHKDQAADVELRIQDSLAKRKSLSHG